jgi:hypothetical protein
MDPLRDPVPDPVVKLLSFEDIYRAKAERRKELAALPFEEKIRIMEKLQEMGRAMRAARKSEANRADGAQE